MSILHDIRFYNDVHESIVGCPWLSLHLSSLLKTSSLHLNMQINLLITKNSASDNHGLIRGGRCSEIELAFSWRQDKR